MANPTTNFGWVMPTSTDLVTDLPADFAVFGQGVDTTMADLKGGTTGQVLSKASNTDMDFTWIEQDDTNAIQNSIVDAKGDLISATANDTPARLAVGTNGQVLTADSTTATGLKWASAASGSLTLLSTTALSGASVTVSSISGSYKNLFIIVNGNSTGNGISFIKFNSSSTNLFASFISQAASSATTSYYAGSYIQGANGLVGNTIQTCTVFDYANASYQKTVSYLEIMNTGNWQTKNLGGGIQDTAAISSITVGLSTGTWASGNVYVYGVN